MKHVYIVHTCINIWDTNFSTVDPTDYGELDMIVQFDVQFDTCDVRQCANVSIVNDLVDEPEELLTELERTPGLDERIDLDPTMGTVVITYDDSTVAYLKGGGQSTPLGGSGGMLPQKILNFWPSEVVSGTF